VIKEPWPEEVLWRPNPDRLKRASLSSFIGWLRDTRDLHFESYDDLWMWSVSDLDEFWAALTDWFGFRWTTPPLSTRKGQVMPGVSWFPGGKLNYAEHLLFPPSREGLSDEDIAVISLREDGSEQMLSWSALRELVSSVRAALAEIGVRPGDRVVSLLPNIPEAVVAMLATASLGGIWSSCSPDFGPQAVLDRFVQIEPTVLFAVDGYQYGGKVFDIRETVRSLEAGLPTLKATIVLPTFESETIEPDWVRWSAVTSRPALDQLEFTPVPFDHPLWILYSSGTTGIPKAIVHSHGGILLVHLSQLALHMDLGPDDRFFWFTTTGWMMWNLLVSGLAAGSAIVLFDGSPAQPDLNALWSMAEQLRITWFGVSAPYLQSCFKAGLSPTSTMNLTAIRSIGSTGAPLPPECFRWVYGNVGTDIMLSSMSGGTDICAAMVGGVPLLPVYAGEITCRMLGCAVEAFDDAGCSVHGVVGELVMTKPMPSMPVALWGDPDGSRLEDAYFNTFPGVWKHGDWIRISDRGTCVIEGRSDSTLNRAGVRMGTSEFYRVVEAHPAVEDSLVIDTSTGGVGGQLLLYVVLNEASPLEVVAAQLRSKIRVQLSPRHVPDQIVEIHEVPRTLSGKKCEVPVKRVLGGADLESVVSLDSLSNPRSFEPFVRMPGEGSR